MRTKQKLFVADTENTVPKETLYEVEAIPEGLHNRKGALRDILKSFKTQTWAVAIAPILESPGADDVTVTNSIDSFMDIIESDELYHDSTIYFHNLTYDAMQILAHLSTRGFKAYDENGSEEQPGTYMVMCNVQGSFYKMDVNYDGYSIHFQDSLKILPFSVEAIAKSLHTKAQKLVGSIDYTIKRYSGWNITEAELKYIQNDVLVMSEALHLMDSKGFNIKKLTIGGICFTDFKRRLYKDEQIRSGKSPQEFRDWVQSKCPQGVNRYEYIYRQYFPEFSAEEDAWFRRAYRGGITRNMTQGAIVDTREDRKTFIANQSRNVLDFVSYQGEQVINHVDVNSLYPSVMHSSTVSPHRYPIGKPHYVDVDSPHFVQTFNRLMQDDSKAFYVEIKITGKVKPGKFAYLQKKYTQAEREHFVDTVMQNGGLSQIQMYSPTEFITDICQPTSFVLTKMDFMRVLECYELASIEYIKVAYFNTLEGIFDSYIDHWFEQKSQAKKAGDKVITLVSKLMLNNLYGKLAQSPIRLARDIWAVDEEIKSEVTRSETTGGYIPVGAYITAYARNVLIDGVHANWGRVCYMDTDSMFVIGDIQGIKMDKYELGAWDLETVDQLGRYVRAKTYIQYKADSLDDLKAGNLDVKITAAGAPALVKLRMQHQVAEFKDGEWYFTALEFDDQDNITTPRRPLMEIFERFQPGLVEAGKLSKTNIKGGAILYPSTFSISLDN